MSDYLSRLAFKNLHPVREVQPRLASRFEPMAPAAEAGDTPVLAAWPPYEPAPWPVEPDRDSAPGLSPGLQPPVQPTAAEITIEPALSLRVTAATATPRPLSPGLEATSPAETRPQVDPPAPNPLLTLNPLPPPLAPPAQPPHRPTAVSQPQVVLSPVSEARPLEPARSAQSRPPLPTQPPEPQLYPAGPGEPRPLPAPSPALPQLEPVTKRAIARPAPAGSAGELATVRPERVEPGAPALPLSPLLRPLPASPAPAPEPVSPPPAPVVQVSIGRIEIRATPPPATPAKRSRPAAEPMSLAEYLHQRNGGRP